MLEKTFLEDGLELNEGQLMNQSPSKGGKYWVFQKERHRRENGYPPLMDDQVFNEWKAFCAKISGAREEVVESIASVLA